MTTAISREAVLTELHDIAIPNVSGLDNILLVIAVLGISVACAVLVALGLFQFSYVKSSVSERGLKEEIFLIGDMSEGEKVPQLLHLLKRYRPERFENLKRFLYRPHPQLTSDRLLQELLADESG